jgi:mRNA-degrading endonuclease RelE of RelBE toxin-antitoxin system
MATVLFTLEAQEQADELPRLIRVRLHGLVERLKAWPNVSGVKGLTGALKGYYRIRTGDYRMQFRVDKDVVTIVKVGHCDGFYEG